MTISATTQGLKPGVCLSTAKPANPFDGQVIYMTDVDQTAVWDGTTWTVLAPIAGGRNKIINGAMSISQRGTSAISNVAATNTYGTDRWHVYGSSASKMTVTQSTTNPTGQGFSYSTLVTSSAATTPGSGDFYGFRQYIEGNNIADLAWGTSSAKPIVVSFWVRSSIAGTYSVTLIGAGNTRTYIATYTISAANTWEKETVYISAGETTGTWETGNGVGANLWFDLGSGTGNNGTAGGWNTSLLTRTSGSTNWVGTSGATFYVTGVQIESGAAATPFEFEDYSTLLQKCKRYYYRAIDPVGVGTCNGQPVRITIPFHTQMRTIPTTNISGTMNFFNGAAIGSTGSIAGIYNTIHHGQIDFSVSGGFGGNANSVVLYSSGGSQYLDFSSEL